MAIPSPRRRDTAGCLEFLPSIAIPVNAQWRPRIPPEKSAFRIWDKTISFPHKNTEMKQAAQVLTFTCAKNLLLTKLKLLFSLPMIWVQLKREGIEGTFGWLQAAATGTRGPSQSVCRNGSRSLRAKL